MTLKELLTTWRADPNFTHNIAAWRTFEARPARTGPLPPELHPALRAALSGQGIERLYSHQATAWQEIRAGRQPVIVTGTASGKSLCYHLPVVDRLLRDADSRALYLFPTKALARDQAESLQHLIQQMTNDERPTTRDRGSKPTAGRRSAVSGHPSAVSIYDGDTPAAARSAIRREARVIISNPDMLHTGILPHHTRWADFFRHLHFIVIDEMHVYRGVFGAHVANVLRRLRRIAHFYETTLQFILTSATIANPLELAEQLIETPVTLVENDGSPRGRRHFLIYNPPLVNQEFGIRRSALRESVRLTRDLLAYNVQSLIFGRTRRTVEMTLRYVREEGQLSVHQNVSPAIDETDDDSTLSQPPPFDKLRTRPARGRSENFPPAAGKRAEKSPQTKPSTSEQPESDASSAIRAYRSGYLPRQRREIERGLREGRVRAVVATNALELGIDIGGMTAVILTGYPGTIAGTWQQAGRAGRQQGEALALLVASANPLDQFLARRPDYFFERSPEQALINPDNLLILLQHLRCAAFELPFKRGDGFGRVEADQVAEFMDFLAETGELHRSDDTYFWMADRYPAQAVSLRSASPERVKLLVRGNGAETIHDDRGAITEQESAPDDDSTWRILGDIDLASAPWLVHPQAIYLHQGQSYRVEQLELAEKTAYLKPTAAGYYTEPRRETTVQLVAVRGQAEINGVVKGYGDLDVTSQVTGYKAIRWFTQERVGEGEVTLPPHTLQTQGYWLALNEITVERLRAAGIWRSGRNDYGPTWPQQRNRARARDGYRCQICGRAEGARQHDVHHKIPFRTFASVEEANRLSNLVTLCRPCHRRAETAVKVRSGLSGLAAVLGHLAPLFLMCDRHDIAVHSDPQSPLTNGRPTAVIYELIPAGLGFSHRLFERHTDLLRQAHELVAACPCAEGCPACVGPAGETGEGGKAETLAILEAVGG